MTSQPGSNPQAPPATDLPTPQGRYVPVVVHHGVAMSAGMTPRIGQELAYRGTIGVDLDLDDGRRAAALAASNALAVIADAVGGPDRIETTLRMTVYLACAADFTQHSVVADAASEALAGVLGERGRVARSAIGVSSLPSGAPVEVELSAVVRS